MTESGSVVEAPLRFELETRYLAYALSTIISRSLPDVRDGLKPVHRRILYAMRGLRLEPGTPHKKSARVVGDVIGRYHPHGDQAAYDAMVRLAQEFATRYPLVDGQGNFGNIDGDGPAAMRYTEARLTAVAWALLEDLDRDTVDFNETYDGSGREPVVLPARFPNLLANGSTGIAVGMSTAIPPHNVGEVLDACLLLTERPEATVADLLVLLPGPDFPTGGVLVADREERLAVYESGRGTLRVRAAWHRETLKRGAWSLVVTEIPYQVRKSRLIERIAYLIVNRNCPFLSDVRDESDEQVRIVLEPRTTRVDPDMVMAYLFKNSELEVRVPVNLNVITADRRPQVWDLKRLLNAWLEHRFEVHTRRAKHELAGIGARLHLLAAYLIVHLNIDEVIAIIKAHDHPGPVLMARFNLDHDQAEAVLNLRLRALRRLEEMAIRQEVAEKEGRAAELRRMLADDRQMWRAVRRELRQTRQEFADPRRTELAAAPQEVTLKPADLTPREPVTVILSQKGWVKTLRGHDETAVDKVRFKGEDALLRALPAHSNETISFLASGGKVFSLLADRLPPGKGFGQPLTILFDMEEGDPVVWALMVDPEMEYLIVTELANGFRIRGRDLVTSYRTGKQVLTFKAGDRLLGVFPVVGEEVATISSGRRLLVCSLRELPLLTRGRGVRLQRLAKGEVLAAATVFDPAIGISLDSGRRVKVFTDLALWRAARASRGMMLPHGFMAGAVFADGLTGQ